MTSPCDCSEAREALWPPERPRLMAVDVEAATRHVEGCESCSRFFALDRRLRSAVEDLRNRRAPLEVRERVFDALADARAARGTVESDTSSAASTLPGRLLAASTLLLAVVAFVAGGVASAPAPEVETEALVVDDFLRRAVGADRRVTDDPEEVAAFLLRELGVRITPLSAPGLALEQVEICLLDGRRSGLIHYRVQGRPVSHYLVPTEKDRHSAPTRAERARVGSARGLPVVSWSVPRLDQALMGDLPSEALLELASKGS